jgi:hypothetical protein
MTIIATNGGVGHPVPGTPELGSLAWRVRPAQGAEPALSGPSVTDYPMTKPPYVSASERCP